MKVIVLPQFQLQTSGCHLKQPSVFNVSRAHKRWTRICNLFTKGMERFKSGDAVFILPRYAHLYSGHSAVVTAAKPDRLRPMFNEYTLQFPDGSGATMFEFQLIDDIPAYATVIADLAFDSRQQMAATQARGHASGSQILLQTKDFDIDLKIRTTRARGSIMGQVLERGTATLLPHVEIRLMKDGTPLDTTTSDAAGAFKFSDVSRGSLNILVVIPKRSLRILGAFSI
jgi:hypothetical protein